ncbi:MAG: hypothetical protein Q4G03_04175 [Planctomycetia bacterium]|nr:hypothetical protein [Planctomycetia bacterium]
MRVALQAIYPDRNDVSQESLARRSRVERELQNDARSMGFYRKLQMILDHPPCRAPEVFADESFPDANIVAEYLDYQSQSEEVELEFERVCLESSEILAEVANCYDILTNCLNQPIEAPRNCRRRLYYLAWETGLAEQPEDCVAQTSQSFNATWNQVESHATANVLPEAQTSTVQSTQTQTPERTTQSARKSSKSSRRSRTITVESQENANSTSIGASGSSVARRARNAVANAVVFCGVFGLGVFALSHRHANMEDYDEGYMNSFVLTPEPIQSANDAEESGPVDFSSNFMTLNDAFVSSSDSFDYSESSDLVAPLDAPRLASLPEPEASPTPLNLEHSSTSHSGLRTDSVIDSIPARNNDVFSRPQRY